MRGGSLTRFRPDDQFGSGFVRDFIGSSVKGGWEGLKTGGVRGLPNIVGGIRGVKKGGKRAVKPKAEQVIQRTTSLAHESHLFQTRASHASPRPRLESTKKSTKRRDD